MRTDKHILISEGVVIVAFFVMVIATFAQVICRYVLEFSIPWADELARYCLVWLVFVGMVVALVRGQHDLHCRSPAVFITFLRNISGDRKAGVVDENIYSAERSGNIRDRLPDRVRIADIQGPGFGAATVIRCRDFPHHGVALALIKIGHGNAGPL